MAVAARSRGLLSAARGDLEEAAADLERALDHHARLEHPLERGRTLLVRGAVQRRALQRRAARESLAEALDAFERLGATLWAERARAEAARIGGRAPSSVALTPTEEQVARLVAEGRTNKEVAEALFLSVRTVEWNLARIYRKLGVRSRAELTRWMVAGERPESASD
jgi:DNA-binding CsgD family transcriptional regulator